MQRPHACQCPYCGKALVQEIVQPVAVMSFISIWTRGLKLLVFVVLYCGFALLVGGTSIAVVYSLIIILPLELIYKTSVAENYTDHMAYLGAATLGVYFLGQGRGILIDYFNSI